MPYIFLSFTFMSITEGSFTFSAEPHFRQQFLCLKGMYY